MFDSLSVGNMFYIGKSVGVGENRFNLGFYITENKEYRVEGKNQQCKLQDSCGLLYVLLQWASQ